MKIFGFTLLRNGIQYDYPYRESLRSLGGICERTFVALGQSQDGTEQSLASIPQLTLIPTVWDEGLRKSGLILSQQTNIALTELRKFSKDGWGIYLQADEVISERDYDRIRADMKEAESVGADAISFRYLHFWQSHRKIAVGKRWYPQEIRAIRLDSAIESWGDAQSFRNHKKIFESDATIYHYGHVRESHAYEQKKKDFNRWWHSDAEMAKIFAKGKRRDAYEEVISYLGPHPNVMNERIRSFEGEISSKKEVLVYGTPSLVPAAFQDKARFLYTQSVSDLWAKNASECLVLQPLPWWAFPLGWMGYKFSVPEGMGSPQARPWPQDFRFLLELSRLGVEVR